MSDPDDRGAAALAERIGALAHGRCCWEPATDAAAILADGSRFLPPDSATPSRDVGFAADRPTGPRTRDGHALASRLRRNDPEVDWDAWVRSIEDQAASGAERIDVERLARATARVVGHNGPLDYHREWATKVAAAYNAIPATDTESEP